MFSDDAQLRCFCVRRMRITIHTGLFLVASMTKFAKPLWNKDDCLIFQGKFFVWKQCPTKNKRKKKLLNKQFVFSVNKRGDFVLPTLVSCAHVHTYTVHIVALHMSRSLYTLRASYISLLRTFYISRVGWEGLIKFEAFVFLALRFTWASVASRNCSWSGVHNRNKSIFTANWLVVLRLA